MTTATAHPETQSYLATQPRAMLQSKCNMLAQQLAGRVGLGHPGIQMVHRCLKRTLFDGKKQDELTDDQLVWKIRILSRWIDLAGETAAQRESLATLFRRFPPSVDEAAE
jgi:hypothetical protein